MVDLAEDLSRLGSAMVVPLAVPAYIALACGLTMSWKAEARESPDIGAFLIGTLLINVGPVVVIGVTLLILFGGSWSAWVQLFPLLLGSLFVLLLASLFVLLIIAGWRAGNPNHPHANRRLTICGLTTIHCLLAILIVASCFPTP